MAKRWLVIKIPEKEFGIDMNDKNQVKLLQDAIEAYENGEILEAKDKAIEFINNITDFEAESEGKERRQISE